MTYMETTQAVAARDAWLGQTHGYRIDGDLACLNAELALPSLSQAALADEWALQLWACDQPYRGGALEGVKIAEAPVALRDQPQQLYAETFARLPAGDRAYAMVLVLASRADGVSGVEERVHDFANYPALEHFNVPTLRGEVTVVRAGDRVSVRAERIENPRGAENLSGSLALELWALPEAYQGGQFAGTALAGVELGRLAGQAELQAVELQLSAAAIEPHAQLTVMLREWTAGGYVTRDYKNLAAEVIAEPASFVLSVSAVPTPVSAPVSEPGPAPAAAPAAAVAAPVAARVASVAVSPVVAEPDVAPASPPTAAPTTAPTAVATAAPTAVPAAAEEALVSVQEASLEQLSAVPGLTRKLALEIIKSRPFRSLEELTRVRGIGEKTLRKLRAVLTL